MGFRKIQTIHNIYKLNYLMNRQLRKRGWKLIILFVDLKAAFDPVNRGVLMEEMKRKGIRKGLIERVEEVLRKTKNRVRVREKTGECFWTARRMRQDCPLNPLLFNILLADLEEEMGKIK